MRSINDVVALTGVAVARGLTAGEVDASRAANGRNVLTSPPQTPVWKLFLAKFNDPIIRILIVAAGLSIAVAVLRHDADHLIEGVAIAVAVVIAAGVSFLAEYRSRREFELLNAEKESVRVRVRRDGAIVEVPIDELVVGDVVLLEAGHEVPADGRVLRSTELSINQSLMTGEVEPVERGAGAANDSGDPLHAEPGTRVNGVLRGTLVVQGNGEILVSEVGDGTALGRIARMLQAGQHDDATPAHLRETATRLQHRRVHDRMDIDRSQTPLQSRLAKLATMISRVGYIAAALVFVGLLVVGVLSGEFSKSAEDITQYVLDALMITVVIIVVAVPEGLPMSVTISLALAMRRMTRANALVRQLMATETVGSTTVICSDKTGTLTENRMKVQGLASAGTDGWTPPDVSAMDRERWRGNRVPAATLPIEHLLLNASVNSTAHLLGEGDDMKPVGNATEASMLRWWHEQGFDYRPLRDNADVAYQLLFTSDRKRMSTVLRHADGADSPVLYAKGAPELLLPLCVAWGDVDGSEKPIDESQRAVFDRLLQGASQDAQRVLCFAHRQLKGAPADQAGLHAMRDSLEEQLVLDALVAIADPVRPEVPPALDRCRAAGIQVKMITGDNIETARAISRRIGLLDTPDARVMDSAEFRRMGNDELLPLLRSVRVLARATPEDKHRMVSLLQQTGEVVAVTGDGTNDAPALKRADVGLSMGSGTEVAKEASRIVLLDDSFATIVRAVAWGRGLYENIQRFLLFQLTINIAALCIAFLGAFLEPLTGVRTPLTAIQLLWINVIMDSLAAIALCSEPPHDSVMTRRPRPRDEFIITPAMTRNMFVTAALFVVLILGLLFVAGSMFGTATAAVQPVPTVVFTLFVMLQVFNLFNCRTIDPRESAFSGLGANRTFLVIAALIVLVQIVVVNVGGAAFHTVPLDLPTWLAIAGVSSLVLVIGELTRLLRRSRASTPA
ncbi:MAG: cation-translocating P-type ATPase [Planctomycetota bacterium]